MLYTIYCDGGENKIFLLEKGIGNESIVIAFLSHGSAQSYIDNKINQENRSILTISEFSPNSFIKFKELISSDEIDNRIYIDIRV